jgi:hypothetical protein
MSNKSKIPTAIGILILIIGLATGVFLVQNSQIFKLGASGSTPPKDVRITNITDSSFTVSWTTQKESDGFVAWGESPSSLAKTESDEISGKSFIHSATIRGLEAQKSYYFKINSQGIDYDNNNIPWEVKLGPSLSSSSLNKVISGTILTATGTPSYPAIVYVSTGALSPLSTTTSENGSWVISLSQARDSSLNSLYDTSKNDLLEISVQAGPAGTSSAQIYLASSSPVPPMILGQVHDFKSLPPGKDESLPTSTIEAPESISQKSKFDLSGLNAATPSSNTITLESIEEGEIVNSTKPEFFGKGPKGTELTITVESENPISASTKVGTSGSWNWSPPEGLAPGTHKVTISWRDADGILRSITKQFIIQAAEGPAFVSTPSASLTPTPKVTSQPISTSSSTPRATATSTSSAVPVSGVPLPTIIMLAMGTVLFASGGTIFFSALKQE